MQTAPLYTENLTAAMYGSMPYKNTTKQTVAPEGYISLDEFRKLVHKDTEEFCIKYDIN